jgi:hypothetical protein
MSKPFQFSMRRLFGAMACFCIASSSFTGVRQLYVITDFDVPSLAIGCVFTGAGIGMIFSKVRYCVLFGVLAFVVLCLTRHGYAD